MVWGTQEWYTVAFLPSEALWEKLACLGLGVHMCPAMLTLVYQGKYEGSAWLLPGVPGPLWAAWHGDSPDLIQPKLTLFSSGLLGLPEWEFLRPNNPFWASGTFLPLQIGESLVCESPCKGTVPPPPGSQFHFERSVVHFALSSAILRRTSLGGSQAP